MKKKSALTLFFIHLTVIVILMNLNGIVLAFMEITISGKIAGPERQVLFGVIVTALFWCLYINYKIAKFLSKELIEILKPHKASLVNILIIISTIITSYLIVLGTGIIFKKFSDINLEMIQILIPILTCNLIASFKEIFASKTK